MPSSCWSPGKGGTLNHLGVEVVGTETVHGELARLCETWQRP